MLIDGSHYRSIWLADDARSVCIIDQRLLPFRVEIEPIRTYREMAVAIRDMHLRGAPLIGAAAGYGVYLACMEFAGLTPGSFDYDLARAMDELDGARPTAVNLHWALERQRMALAACTSLEGKVMAALETARTIADEDVQICAALGRHGAALLEDLCAARYGRPVQILTHCNAGWLATVDHGTATAGIYEAARRGVPLHVWVDETRPRNQGALTSWELTQNGIPNTVICDNAGGHLMQAGQVDVVIVGTDRTARNGDVANKIGTYLKALAARDNGVPFYVALPSPTFDPDLPMGLGNIPIEERDQSEVIRIRGMVDRKYSATVSIYAEGTKAANPAFDVTPARLVTGYITEKGIFTPGTLADGLGAGLAPASKPSTTPLTGMHTVMAEGVIKFRVKNRRPEPPLAREDYQDIETIRARLWQRRLIGHDREADVGYGNISSRWSLGGFVVSGTQTGHKEVLDGGDYVVVDDWDFARNSVSCSGPCLPSSEALSHAALYRRPDVGGVIHVHSRVLWDALIKTGALCTEDHIAYGSEAMYRRLAQLAGCGTGAGLDGSDPAGKVPDLPLIIVTKGHQDGVFVAGADLAEAYEAILGLLA